MAEISSRNLISSLGLIDATLIEGDGWWELWRYGVRDPASRAMAPGNFYLLLIKSRGASWIKLESISSQIRQLAKQGPLTLALPKQSLFKRDQERARELVNAIYVNTYQDLLTQQCKYLIGQPIHAFERVDYFVEPYIAGKLALDSLIQWISGDSPTSAGLGGTSGNEEGNTPSIAVLLAPAGVGKTSLARQLATTLPQKTPAVVPIFIEPRQWAELTLSRRPTVWEFLSCSLQSRGQSIPPRDAFETFSQAGCISVIFDGLDEVGAIRRSEITPLDLVIQLQELAEGTDFRVLMTSRDSLWSELVTAEQRSRITEFQLEPFGRQQIAKYRERRFPRSADPARAKFDKLLESLTKVTHPNGTKHIPQDERIQAAPLMLDILATEAEDASSMETDIIGPIADRPRVNPLYAVTFGILNREHSKRGLSLSPSRQFAMLTHLVELGDPPYNRESIELACETADAKLSEQDHVTLTGHPLLQRVGNDQYIFRFEFLVRFAPAVWITEHIVTTQRNTHVERQLAICAGRSSPVLGFVKDLLESEHWQDILRIYVSRLRDSQRQNDNRTGALTAIWELGQSLLSSVEIRDPSARMREMARLYGHTDGSAIAFEHMTFRGPISHLDLRNVTFEYCLFEDVEWISCLIDSSTTFRRCTYHGRFRNARTPIRQALFVGLREDSVDTYARMDLEEFLGDDRPIAVNRESIVHVMTLLLEALHAGAFFIPRQRTLLVRRVAGSEKLGNSLLDMMLTRHVLEESAGTHDLKVAKKNQHAVISLLDNGTVGGAIADVVREALRQFGGDAG